jgi:hypothetical protein
MLINNIKNFIEISMGYQITQYFMMIQNSFKWAQKKSRKKVIGKKLSEF